jgi:FkbM family methyltransferase
MTNSACNEFYDFAKVYSGERIELCFDIGSRDCGESIALNNLLDCDVVAFEPNPDQYTVCKSFESSRIKVEPIALSNFVGKSTFFKTPGNIGAASLLKPLSVPHTFDNTIVEVEVTVDTLNNYCNRVNKYPNLIWMDVQGSELNVISNMDKPILDNLIYICSEVGIIPYYEGHTLEDQIKSTLIKYGFSLIFEKLEWEKEKFCIFKKN